jgi:ABC-type Fe3+-hydroxamate transport system substrate-binding protein
MTDPRRGSPRHARPVAALLALLLAGCASISPPPSASPSGSAGPSLSASAGPSLPATATPAPTATPIPHLGLAPAGTADPRQVSVGVSVELPADGSGRIVVTVENLSGQFIQELVLRWPTELRDTISLAPFAPSEQRIREGGPPLYQEWTKWVEGPGEQGEPAGTISLGWGPLLVGGTLTIPILATRVAPGPLRFDLQLLAGEALLTTPDGPAWLQVEVP